MFCTRCGSPNDAGAKFCQKCGTALAADAPAPAPAPTTDAPAMRGERAPPVAGKRYAQGKNAVLAVVLSVLIIGVGQFYNGDVKKGAVMLGAAILLAVPTGGIAWFPLVIWSAIDAYQVASGKSALW